MIQKAQQHTLEFRVYFPVVRRQTEVAAEAARFVEARRQLLERGSRNQPVTTELGVAFVSQRMRVDEAIGTRARRRTSKLLDPPPIRKRVAIPCAVGRAER